MDTFCNVARFLPEQAARQPDRVALLAPIGGGIGTPIRYRQKTFAELEAEANAAALLMRERGIRRGSRVLLMVRPGVDLIRITFGLFKLGAIPIVIDPGMGLKSFRRCVAHSQPDALVGIPLAQMVSHLFRGDFRSVSIRITAGTAGFEKALSRMAKRSESVLTYTLASDPAAILFTSGSTGAPKGVCYEHGMFEAQVRLLKEHYGIKPGEVDLPMLPIFALFNPALGMTTVIPQINPSRPATVEPERIVRAILQNNVTNSFGSPVLWTKIAAWCRSNNQPLLSVRRVLMAGAPVPPSLMREFAPFLPSGEIHTPYGATECLPLSSITAKEILEETASLTEAGKGMCVGRELPGMEVRVVRSVEQPLAWLFDAEELPADEIGEIIATGPSVTKAYDGLPEATARAKLEDARGRTWHRMGDVGYRDAKGRIWFCGRQSEVVKTAGGPLYPACCEAIFNQHEHVQRTALIGIGQDRSIPAIVVEPHPNFFPKSEQARKQFSEELRAIGQQTSFTAGIMHFFYQQHLPVDVRHNAKIHRGELAEKYANCHEV